MPVGVEAPVDASTTFAVKVMFPLGVTLEAEAVAVVAEARPGGWQHLDLAHHAAIFVLQDVAVIDERCR